MAGAERKKVARKSAEERAAEIRDAARQLALEDGLVAVTLRAVAARVDVVPALVAHYQPSMEQLVADTFRAITGDELADVIAMTSEGAAPARLRTLISTALDPSRDDVTAVWVDAWSIGRRNPALADAVREQADAWEAHASSIVRAGMEAGDFNRTDLSPDAVAWLLIGIFDGLNSQSVVHSRHDPARIRVLQRAIEHELSLPADALGSSV